MKQWYVRVPRIEIMLTFMSTKGNNNLKNTIMKATKVLQFLSINPDSANHFGVSENLDLRSMFGVGSLCGAYPQAQYAWFWGANNIPTDVPDFVYSTGDSKVYGYILD